MEVCIVIPVYNDWPSLNELLDQLSAHLAMRNDHFSLLIVDDASTREECNITVPPIFHQGTILRLRRNLGHQRAIAIGLAWLHDHHPSDAIVVMDGDGEDKPEDVPRLLQHFGAFGGLKSVFAERTRRSESLLFTFFYRLYRLSHWIMTGIPVKIGNFSVLSAKHLESVVVCSEMWNHYAAATVRLRIPIDTIPTHRGFRYQGSSRMNFTSLVRHGICALAVHSDIIGVRFMIVAAISSVICLLSLLTCVGIRIFSNVAIPGWATYVSILLLILMIQIGSITFSVTVHALSNANSNSFIPMRDYAHFVKQAENNAEGVRAAAVSKS